MSETDPTPEANASAPSEVDLLRRQLEEVTGRLRTVSKAFNDQQVEQKQFRDRLEVSTKARAERQALDMVRAFLDPVMNLKRSIHAEHASTEALTDGLKMVHHQFMETLTRLGLEEVPGVGQAFDPRFHEALGTVEVLDREHDGLIIAVHSDGYHVKGQVVQTARVTVGRFVEPAGEA